MFPFMEMAKDLYPVWNTSTVALRVVGGEENGSLEPEAVKHGHESHGTQTRV
jgi:hypothetical protein